MTNTDNRYGPAELYNMVALACPYYKALQTRIGVVLADMLAKRSISAPRIIEIGTGPGMTLIGILAAISNAKIVSLDKDPKMTRVAREDIGRRRGVRIVTEEAYKFLRHINPDCVHAVVSGCTLHNLEIDCQQGILSQAARVIAPGGVLVIGDKIAVEDEELHQFQLESEMEKLAVFDRLGYPELTEMWREHYFEDESHKLTESQFTEMLAAAGFTDIRFVQRFGLDVILTAARY